MLPVHTVIDPLIVKFLRKRQTSTIFFHQERILWEFSLIDQGEKALGTIPIV
jgi:hypothetical protein